MNKANIISIFGRKEGTKLMSWLDPCCPDFCNAVKACGGGGFSLPITTDLGGGRIATYDQNNNALGLGLTGAGQTFDTGSGGYNIITTIDASPFGGSKNTTFVGYLTPGSGTEALGQFAYYPSSDKSIIQLAAQNAASRAQIALTAEGVPSIEFSFNTAPTHSYKFPILSPSAGQVLGYTAPNQLGWVSAGGGITIGSPVSGGTASRFLYVDGSGNLANAANVYLNPAGIFEVFKPSTTNPYLYIDGTSGYCGIGDILSTANKTFFDVNDSNGYIVAHSDNKVSVVNSTGFIFLDLDITNKLYQLGDLGTSLNGTKVSIDDVAKLVTISNVPVHADDAAAATAGLTTGQLYKTTTGGSTFLKIVP